MHVESALCVWMTIVMHTCAHKYTVDANTGFMRSVVKWTTNKRFANLVVNCPPFRWPIQLTPPLSWLVICLYKFDC